MSGAPDWTDHGAFRAAFLERFQPKDRPILQRAGVLLAEGVEPAPRTEQPLTLSLFAAALEDARALATLLAEIANLAEDGLSDSGLHLAMEAHRHLHAAEELVRGLAGSLDSAAQIRREEEKPGGAP